ncbi:NfeD family protein [Streptomyces sp. JJ66]|nr:NfeD family protein [Streptomyces sp. JJ66]
MPELGMLAVGAGAGSLVAALGGGIVAQVVVFAVVSTALILVIQPVARRMRAERPELASGVDAIKGRQAIVLERVDGSGGRVKIGGEVWSARALEAETAYEPGHRVDVVEIDGATAVVM